MTENVFYGYTDPETFAKIVDYSSVSEMWEHSIRAYPQNVAITDNGEYTYSALNGAVARFRGLLSEKGIKQGDNVGVYMPNRVEFVKAFLAITTLGAVAVLIPPHLDAATVFGCSLKFGLRALVYSSETAEGLSVIKSQNLPLALIDGSEDFDREASAHFPSPASPCTVLFTGGTTGKSKGARLSHRAVMAGTKNGCYGYPDVFGQRYLLVLPLTHVFGLIRNLLTTLYTGGNLFICRNSKDMFRDIAAFKPTMLVLVPALAEMALNLSKQFGRNMLGSDVKQIICGAATVSPYLVQEYLKFGIHLLPGYGLTESANLVSGNPEALRKPESVGFFYPGMDYKIVDGELWLKGVNMMDGYVSEDENANAYSEDGYFKTGDLVHIDEEGFLYITGRTKEIIVLSTGENISPAELEGHFCSVDEIQDCLVYSEMNGGSEILAIEIFPRALAVKAAGITDIEGFMKSKVEQINRKLPPFQRISKVVIRESDFVRSPSMKIVRNKNGNCKN